MSGWIPLSVNNNKIVLKDNYKNTNTVNKFKSLCKEK